MGCFFREQNNNNEHELTRKSTTNETLLLPKANMVPSKYNFFIN